MTAANPCQRPHCGGSVWPDQFGERRCSLCGRSPDPASEAERVRVNQLDESDHAFGWSVKAIEREPIEPGRRGRPPKAIPEATRERLAAYGAR